MVNYVFMKTKYFLQTVTCFRVFTHQFIEGNPRTALMAPNSMVLDTISGRKIFWKEKSYVGKTLENASGDVYKVTAVIKDVPKNSHIHF